MFFANSILDSSSTPIFLFLICALWLSVYRRIQHRTPKLALPPGPPAHWLFGNRMPDSFAHRKFEEWTEEYGSVFTLRQGCNTLIVIGRQDAALEIMEKEGGSLVDRPRSISAGETLSGGMRMLITGAGDRFKKLRRGFRNYSALHASLSAHASKAYEPTQMLNAKILVLDILKDPKNHQMHAKRYAASVILSMTYGKSIPSSCEDPEVIQINKCNDIVGRTMLPGAWLVDSYPLLRHVPGYLSQLKRWHQEELHFFRKQLTAVRMDFIKGKAPTSFARYLLEHQQRFQLSDDELAYLAGSMFGAGADTTASAISIMIMAAAVFPDAQARVQDELDLVVGLEKPPVISDENALPQTKAFILETYRWRPVNVGGVAHRATADIVWRNYRIPAGSNVIGNHWSIGRDPAVFTEPEKFDPQRWLTKDGNINNAAKMYPFGFGRRICPGQHVASRSVFINTALLLWGFQVSQIPSSPIDTFAFTDSMNTHPLPFTVNFSTRNRTPEELGILMEDHYDFN